MTNHPGAGKHMDSKPLNEPFGRYYRNRRERLHPMTLVGFCGKNGFDHSQLSKIERGVLPPPASLLKLARLGQAIGIFDGNSEWQEFVDRAYAARGEVPPDLAGRGDVTNRLPTIYRALRGDLLREEEVEDLEQLIRGQTRFRHSGS